MRGLRFEPGAEPGIVGRLMHQAPPAEIVEESHFRLRIGDFGSWKKDYLKSAVQIPESEIAVRWAFQPDTFKASAWKADITSAKQIVTRERMVETLPASASAAPLRPARRA